MGLRIVAVITVASLMALASAPLGAAVLDGSTVTATYWFGATASPPTVTCTTSLSCEVPNYPLFPGDTAGQNFPPPMVPVAFLEGASSGVQISVDDTQIVITDVVSGPFCVLSTAAQCPGPDVFNGFSFAFSGAEAITGVSVDKNNSAADFRPAPSDVTFTSTEIFVNVAGTRPQHRRHTHPPRQPVNEAARSPNPRPGP